MKVSSLFKGFWNLERLRGGVWAVWNPPSALNPSRWVLYSIFMQAWVLWEEPELAVDSERSRSSGNRDPVDAICPIIFISFGQRWVPTSRLRKETKTTLSHLIHVFIFYSTLNVWQWWLAYSNWFVKNTEVLPFRKDMHHLALQS